MKSFDPQLFEYDDRTAQIIGYHCDRCDSTTLVAGERCAVCGERSVRRRHFDSGTVSVTCTAGFALHAAEPPTVIAQVALAPTLEVVGVVDGPASPGDRVRVAPMRLASGGGDVMGYCFVGENADA